MVVARFAAAVSAAVLVGWLWITFNGDTAMAHDHDHAHIGATKWDIFRAAAVAELMNAGGFLVLGAMAAALIKVAVPQAWFTAMGRYPWLTVLVMAALAVVLSLCSEADAFIAASFTHVSPTAQLVFLTVGPMVDITLMLMQSGAWGKKFVVLFVPTTVIMAILSANLWGSLLG